MTKPRIIAFYLPQYHPIKENDEWWGKGFTEWTNVGKAKALFKGHDQPRVPTELGYYDLRLPIVREQQAQLAREAGVEGFMYWHYWFGNGKTLMADIFNEVVATGKPDFPFCIGWANHSWYNKTWNHDGTSTNKLLMEQTYPGEEDAKMYFDSLLPAFKDDRYLKVDGKPIFVVFAPDDLPDEYMELFQKYAGENGLPGIYFIAYLNNEGKDKSHYLNRGFSSVFYQRFTRSLSKAIEGNEFLNKLFKRGLKRLKGYLTHRPPYAYDYKKESQYFVTDHEKEEDVVPVMMPNFDHTPRSGWNGIFYYNATPDNFYTHAMEAIEAVTSKPEEKQLIFLKSWNEWGEGNYMEPDLTYGRGYIEALRKAIEDSKD